jgi:ABC-2 type transport system permease protein
MAATARSLPGPFAACLTYALRVCLPAKRLALLAVPTVGAVLFGVLALAIDDPTPEGAFNSVTGALFGLVLPFASLVVGDAVLGAERRSGALALTWLSPTSFTTIVLARWLAGWAVAAGALAPAMAVAAAVAGVPDGIGPLVLAAAAASGAYVALFILVGAAFQRAALWSLAIVMLGERLLGEVLAGIAQLSPQWLARTTYADLGPDADELLRDGVPSGWAAVLRLAIVTAVVLLVAVRQVRRLQLAGVSD